MVQLAPGKKMNPEFFPRRYVMSNSANCTLSMARSFCLLQNISPPFSL